MLRELRFKIIVSLCLIVVPVAVGVAGYMYIESYSFLDALYMTVITVATIGYGEVRPMSDAGRIFTIVLIIFNLGLFTYTVSYITGILVRLEFFKRLKLNKMRQSIDRLQQHVIVCGYGRNGREVCDMLRKHNIPFVVLDNQPGIVQKLEMQTELLYLGDDATRDEVLRNAGIERARGLITTLPNDADNLYVVLAAREVNPVVTIISRASNDSSVTKLKRAGADNVIMPDKIGGAHMASLIVSPDVKEFIDIISGQGDAGIRIFELPASHLFSGNSASIASLNLRQETGVTIIGVKKSGGNYIINPDLDFELQQDNKLILLGTQEQVKRLRKIEQG